MFRHLTAAAAIFGLLAAQPAVAELACNSPAELAALQFRQFQAILNVAALKCEGSGFDYAGGYNAFVERARPALEDNALRLGALFTRMGRSSGYIDHYETELFNEVQGGSESVANYCRTSANLMARVGSTSTADLAALAAEIVGSPYGGRACQIRWADNDR